MKDASESRTPGHGREVNPGYLAPLRGVDSTAVVLRRFALSVTISCAPPPFSRPFV
jgi:hypothetical protein